MKYKELIVQDFPTPKEDVLFWIDYAQNVGYRATKYALGWHQLTPKKTKSARHKTRLTLKDTGVTLVFRKGKLTEIINTTPQEASSL